MCDLAVKIRANLADVTFEGRQQATAVGPLRAGIEAGERAGRSPIKTASAKSGQSPSVSEASFISAAQHADGQGGHTDNNDLFAPLSSQRPDSRTPALPPTHNNGARWG